MRTLIAGNWKMNGLARDLSEIEAVADAVRASRPPADVLICLPATLVDRAARLASGAIEIGGETCSAEGAGSFTGDVDAEMLRDAGAGAVIVGHSERRQGHGETDAIVAAQAVAARRVDLMAIICIGESNAQRLRGEAPAACDRQIVGSVPADATSSAVVIGYEPLWAVGTGRTATLSEIVDTHAHIRLSLEAHLGLAGKDVRILYGGSVTPENAAEILALPQVGGVLVGGASLHATDFCAIVRAAAAVTASRAM
jgi:triosephosphate isomerase